MPLDNRFMMQHYERLQSTLALTPQIREALTVHTYYLQSDYFIETLLILGNANLFPNEVVDREIASWLREASLDQQPDVIIHNYVVVLDNLNLLNPLYLTLHRFSGSSVVFFQKRKAMLIISKLFRDSSVLGLTIDAAQAWQVFTRITDIKILHAISNCISSLSKTFLFEKIPAAIFKVMCVTPLIDECCLEILQHCFTKLKEYGEQNSINLEKIAEKIEGFSTRKDVVTVNHMRGMLSQHCLLSIANFGFWNAPAQFVMNVEMHPEAAYLLFQAGIPASRFMGMLDESQKNCLRVYQKTVLVECIAAQHIVLSEFSTFTNAYENLVSQFSENEFLQQFKNKINYLKKALNFRDFDLFKSLGVLIKDVFSPGKAVSCEENMVIFFKENFFKSLKEVLEILCYVYPNWREPSCFALEPIFNFLVMATSDESGKSIIEYIQKILNRLEAVNDFTKERVDSFLNALLGMQERESAHTIYQRLVEYLAELSEYTCPCISESIQIKMREEPVNLEVLFQYAGVSLSKFAVQKSGLQALLLDYAETVVSLCQHDYFSFDQLIRLYDMNEPAFVAVLTSEWKPTFHTEILHAQMILGIVQPELDENEVVETPIYRV